MKSLTNNKVLYTAAILAFANSVHAASPNITFYGEIDASVVSTKAEGGSTTSSVNSGDMNTSYVGVKSKMDLGDGLSGLLKLESFLKVDTGGAGLSGKASDFYARNAYVGLEGGFGTVTLGRNTTPYFISVILSNPLVGSFGFGPSIKHTYLGGLAGAGTGWSNSVAYSAPSLGGFNASILYSAGEVAGESGIDKLGGNAFYRVGKFTGTIAYQSVDAKADDSTKPSSDNQTAGLLGVSYDLDAAKLFAQYQDMKDKYAAGNTNYKTVQLGVSIPINKSSVLISYADTKVTGASDYKHNTLTLAYTYTLSDKASLYAAAYNDDFSNVSGQGSKVGLGGRFSF